MMANQEVIEPLKELLRQEMTKNSSHFMESAGKPVLLKASLGKEGRMETGLIMLSILSLSHAFQLPKLKKKSPWFRSAGKFLKRSCQSDLMESAGKPGWLKASLGKEGRMETWLIMLSILSLSHAFQLPKLKKKSPWFRTAGKFLKRSCQSDHESISSACIPRFFLGEGILKLF